MKTRVFSLLLLGLGSVAAFAQGTIQVGNGITPNRFPIYGPELYAPDRMVVGNGPLSQPTGTTVFTGGLLSGTRYVIEFWAGPAFATEFDHLTLITSMTFRTGSDPLALPNGITLSTTMAIPGVPAGSQAKLAVRVWDNAYGYGFPYGYMNAWARGQGALFLSAPLGGNPPVGGPITPPAWVGQSFSISIIPEPSSLALAGLSAASLLLFRRQKHLTVTNAAPASWSAAALCRFSILGARRESGGGLSQSKTSQNFLTGF